MDSGIVNPLRLRWVKGVCVFTCSQPPALLAEWPRSFTCHCGNTGVAQTQNKSQHSKLTPEKKILPPLLPGFELATFQSRVRLFTNKLSWLLGKKSKNEQTTRISLFVLSLSSGKPIEPVRMMTCTICPLSRHSSGGHVCLLPFPPHVWLPPFL